MKSLQYMLCGLLLLVVGSIQAQSLVDPGVDPPEPWLKYKVTVTAANSTACNVSGTGQYVTGTNVTISSSAKSTDYTFSYWTKNGVRIDQPATFTYTIDSENVAFVAYYTYTPEDPADPVIINQHRLYLVSSPEGACSFNRTSGAKVDYDTYVSLNAYASQGYVFRGWYNGETKVSDVISFSYLMPNENTTLTTRFVYDPADPDDPSSPDGANPQTHPTGDANEDGSVDVTDAVAVINAYLTNDTSGINVSLADVNKDGVIDITDAVAIINLYLNAN
ncbi:MAG: hypothetical protein IK144_08320 [Bacteroidaceae bacterium]|nr:hypothetical protein [Bacteroidaceae bacterium]